MDRSPIRDPTDPEESRLRQAVIDARTKCVFTGGKAREAQANLKQLGGNLRYQPLTDAEKNARRIELKREAEATALADAEAIGAFNEAQQCLDEYLAEKAARTSSESVIPLPAPAESGLVPVVAAASASGPRELPSGSTRRGAPAPDSKPRASERKRKGPMTIPFVGWTIHRPSLKALVAAALILGAGFIVAIGWAFMFGPLRAPTVDTSKAPAITTGTPGGGGQSNMPGYVVDPTTCEITDDVTGEVIGIKTDCTPTDAFPSRVPASPNENLNFVDQPGECGVIHDYPLTDLPEVATSGNYIVVENYDLDVAGDPEVESVLWHGRYAVVGNLDGYVWEYSVECSLDEVMAFVQTQIDNRLKDGMNNAGLASQETTDARFSLIDNQAPFWGHFDPDRKNPDAPTCKVMKEYPLAGHNRLSTEGSFIHVEHYVGGEPERESILNGDSSWRVNDGAKGFVWEYNKACSWGQVRAEVRQHTQRRLADHANNAGWIAWDAPSLNNRFEQVR